MNELLATRTLFEGTHLEVKKGKTIYWQNSIYSENWQSWTISIFHKVDDKFGYFDRVRQRDFSREVQRMRDNAMKNNLRVIISPRATIHGAKLLAAGLSESEVKNMVIFKGVGEKERNILEKGKA